MASLKKGDEFEHKEYGPISVRRVVENTCVRFYVFETKKEHSDPIVEFYENVGLL